MNKVEIILNSIESLGYGNTEGQIFLVDDMKINIMVIEMHHW